MDDRGNITDASTELEQCLTGEFYGLVPKERRENALFRRRCLELGYENRSFREDLWIMCARDFLFYVNTFGWLLEPRITGDDPKVIPFLTYGYQDDAMSKMIDAIGHKDIGIHKSRATGATWMTLYIVDWFWRFKDWVQIGLVSRTEDAVDNPDDPDSLMSKLDFVRDHLPFWLNPVQYVRKVSNHSLINVDRNNSVIGYSAVGDVGRGGRKLFFVLDEFHSFKTGEDYAAHDSTQHVTNSRVIISTPNRKRGPSGAYYDLVKDEGSNMLLLTLDWKDDPHKRAGMYTSKNGKLKILDEEYRFPVDYEFELDGKVRSPYYDFECKRPLATPQSIAAELDRNFGGAAYQFFSGSLLERVKETHVRSPHRRGIVSYDTEDYTPSWDDRENAPWHLWANPNAFGKFGRDDSYSMGIDVAAGTGGSHSSNSAIVIFDSKTGEQVAEFASNTIRPDLFAALCVAVGKWFNDAFMVPEINGPLGQTFIKEVLRIGYRNMYLRNVEHVGFKKKTAKPGYYNTDRGEVILGEMQRAMDTGECTIRSDRIIHECGQYIYKNGTLVHAGSSATEDESAKGKGHGDLAIAAACGWHGVMDRPVIGRKETGEDARPGSFAWRRRRRSQGAIDSNGW